jgi:hypothetical protein
MSLFREFEIQVLHILASPVLGKEIVKTLVEEAELVSYEHSGAGYFLTVRHKCLPKPRIVFSDPVVIGRLGEIEGGFLIFIENEELMLECYSASATDIPNDFRERSAPVSLILN